MPEMPQLPLALSVDTLLISPPDKGCLLFLQKEQGQRSTFRHQSQSITDLILNNDIRR